MKYIEFLKLIAETVTAISAAIVVLIHLFKIIPKSIKVLFSKTIPLFIKAYAIDYNWANEKSLKLEKLQ